MAHLNVNKKFFFKFLALTAQMHSVYGKKVVCKIYL